LEVERGGIVTKWSSLLTGVRGVSQCCDHYLRHVVGYTMLVGEKLVPGYPEQENNQVWDSLLGSFPAAATYEYLRRSIASGHDVRVPVGQLRVNSVPLYLCTTSAKDYVSLVKRRCVTVEAVHDGMAEMYGSTYADKVCADVLDWGGKKDMAMAPVITGVPRPHLADARVVIAITRVLGEQKRGLSGIDIYKELNRYWDVDVHTVLIVLRQNVGIAWTGRKDRGRVIYMVKKACERRRGPRIKAGIDVLMRGSCPNSDVVDKPSILHGVAQSSINVIILDRPPPVRDNTAL